MFLTPSLGIGGSEKLTVGYALGMQARGHETAVAYGLIDSRAQPLREAGIVLYELSRQRLKPWRMGQWVSALRRAIVAFRPDVVHAQSVTAALVVRAAAPSLPVLVTIHGISRANEPLASLLLRTARVRLTAVSDASAAGLTRHAWSPGVEVLSPGIDRDLLVLEAGREQPELPGHPRLVCVARQHPAKGVDVLLRSLPRVVQEHPQVGLTVIGTGVDLEANRDLAAELGVDAHVLFVGLTHSAAPYIGAADVLVLPSRREGLPLTVLEALTLGCPVVATAVGGTPTVVIDGETGWLVPPEDVGALAQGILAALGDPAEAARRAEAGRQLVAERFSHRRMLDRIEELLVELARSGEGVPPAKPRLYHRAVRAHQGGRIALWRATPARRAEWQGVRIFGFHRVSPDDDVFCVSPRDFRAQMELLARSDVEVVRLDTALDLLASPVSGRYACITFDDGYLDNLEHAVPVLHELGLPATIFAISGVLEGTAGYEWYDAPPPHLTPDDLAEVLAGGLVDVQAHSHTHRRLTTLTDEDLREEVAGCREALSRLLPYEPTSFSYPAGLYGEREAEAVRAAGFRGAVSTAPGVNGGGASTFALRRTMIYWGDDAARFRARLDGALDRPSRVVTLLQERRARGRRRS